MKRIVLMLLLAVATIAQAKPVDYTTLSRIASRFCNDRAFEMTMIGQEMALFQWDGGFVLLAADDCVRPVLAYSTTGNAFSLDGMPSNLQLWIDGYRHEIASCVEAGVPQSPAVAAEWEHFLGGLSPKNGTTVVEPMLTTTWNQWPYYNAMCPYDTVLEVYSVTGCSATATAQIMKYWNHPAMGVGSHSYVHPEYGLLEAIFDTTHYRWDWMPDALNGLSDSVAVMAVAELMYQVGVSMEMDYSPEGSGAAVISYGYLEYPSAEKALRDYFKYSPMLRGLSKQEYSDSEWDAMMHFELESGRPILYAGFDSVGGHAFVLDGCDSLGFFHVNWGWGGSNDGYYTIDSLSPGSGGAGGNATYTFNINNQAVIGIYPMSQTNDSLAIVDMRSDPTMGYVEGNGMYVPLQDHVTLVARANEGYRFVGWAMGGNSNPVEFLAVGDLSDSALFERVEGDTLGYCGDGLKSAWQDDWGATTEWGIRLPASIRARQRSISAAQLFVYASGNYIISVYQGDSICSENLLHSEQFHLNGRRWRTATFSSPVPLSSSATAWLTVKHTNYDYYDYPAAHSYYSGNSDGSWYHKPEGWVRYDREGVYCTWMLRAILEPRDPSIGIHAATDDGPAVHIDGRTVSVDSDEALFFDVMGRRLGAGRRVVLPAAGVYILRCDGHTSKIIIN